MKFEWTITDSPFKCFVLANVVLEHIIEYFHILCKKYVFIISYKVDFKSMDCFLLVLKNKLILAHKDLFVYLFLLIIALRPF